jgi:hypothetical protein
MIPLRLKTYWKLTAYNRLSREPAIPYNFFLIYLEFLFARIRVAALSHANTALVEIEKYGKNVVEDAVGIRGSPCTGNYLPRPFELERFVMRYLCICIYTDNEEAQREKTDL